MSWVLRKGEIVDVQRLLGPLPRRMQLGMIQQSRESDLFAVADEESGRLLVAGGFWPWPDGHPYDEAWMLTNRNIQLPARVMLEACARALEARPAGRTVVAFIEAARPAHMRFATFLGFESYRLPVLPILRRNCQLMAWRP